MAGIIDLRGIVLPVMDLRLKFGLEHKDYDKNTVILVVSADGKEAGLIVDSVSDVINFRRDEIQPPPSMASDEYGHVEALGKREGRMYILLDVNKILGEVL